MSSIHSPRGPGRPRPEALRSRLFSCDVAPLEVALGVRIEPVSTTCQDKLRDEHTGTPDLHTVAARRRGPAPAALPSRSCRPSRFWLSAGLAVAWGPRVEPCAATDG